MADSFTSQLRLVQQSDQSNTNIWGNNFNQGVIDLIETAIAGRQDIDVTFASQTLTLANGGVDTARAMMLHVTGNPGEAREVIVPSLQKVYVVANETSPGFNVQVKTAANSGVIIPAGTASIVYVDQANDVVVSPITSGNTVSALATPFSQFTFDILNATSGSTTVTVDYGHQGNLIWLKIPVIITTISTATFTLQPQGSVPVDLIPSGPNANEFPVCAIENGVIRPAFLQVPPANADWLINRADFAAWNAGQQKAFFWQQHVILHVVGP